MRLYFAKISNKFNINFFYQKKLILIDTFLLSNFIDNDRYYTNLTKNINEKNENIFFIPTLIFSKRPKINEFKSFFSKLRKSKRNFLIKEGIINITDIFFALNYYFRILKIKKHNLIFNGTNYSQLVYKELYSTNGYNTSIESLLNYRFIKRLSEYNIDIKYFINWWENQSLDKAYNFALNKYYKNTERIGYLGYVPRDLEMQLSPSENEIKSNVIPNTIGIIGEGYENNIKYIFDKINIKVLPALRFEHLWNNKIYKSNNFIFIALPMLISESYKIMEMILNANKLNKIELNYFIKVHPTVSEYLYLNKYVFPKNFHFSDKTTYELIHSSRIVLSGISSICMESICIGKPTIIIENNKCLNFNPIPKKIDSSLYKKVDNHQDLSNSINFFLNLNNEQNELLKRKSTALKNYYFEKPTKNNKREMLKLN